MTRALLIVPLCIGAVAAFASAGLSDNPVTLQLGNGDSVRVEIFQIVRLPDGVVGLNISYLTKHPPDNEAVWDEMSLVWDALLPTLRERNITHGVLKAFTIPLKSEGVTDRTGAIRRACLTPTGGTLWIFLDGSLAQSDQVTGKRCAESGGI